MSFPHLYWFKLVFRQLLYTNGTLPYFAGKRIGKYEKKTRHFRRDTFK